MRFVHLAGSALMLLGSVALAAEGDALKVSGDGVNVRARPESGAPILRQVNREEPVADIIQELVDEAAAALGSRA